MHNPEAKALVASSTAPLLKPWSGIRNRNPELFALSAFNSKVSDRGDVAVFLHNKPGRTLATVYLEDIAEKLEEASDHWEQYLNVVTGEFE